MTAAAPGLVSVRRAEDETPCRACPEPIRPGQRAALVLGRGQVHVKCLLTLNEKESTHGR